MTSGTAPSMRNANSYDSITPSNSGFTLSLASCSWLMRSQQVELLALQLGRQLRVLDIRHLACRPCRHR